MPREHKFAVGDKWVETCLEVTTLLCEATYTRERLLKTFLTNNGRNC
jgi:hypothetical protein